MSLSISLATTAYFALSAAVLTIVRARNKRTLNGNRLFQSRFFSDRQILLQLSNSNYQTKLSKHDWPELNALGPCFSTLANDLLQGDSLMEALHKQGDLSDSVRQLLTANAEALLVAMRKMAESYLLRRRGKSSARASKPVVPEGTLVGEKGKGYRPIKFIAKGSGGSVFSAVRIEVASKLSKLVPGKAQETASDKPVQSSSRSLLKLKNAVRTQLNRQLVLKQIEPAQKSSAENEYRVAQKLRELDVEDRCITYLDRAVGADGNLWLLLRRISPSTYGIDLAHYIESKFFQLDQNGHQGFSRGIVLSLLEGLVVVAQAGVVMRDVKPDNVLIEEEERKTAAGFETTYIARWSDFGLSVDMSLEGVRSPARIKNVDDKDELIESLVGFWYDTQKIVPKPKWAGRRPPEECYQNPNKAPASSYDMYMFGIIVLSIALGVDIPHIGKQSTKRAFEMIIREPLEKGYLKNGRVEDWISKYAAIFKPHFLRTFGEQFGAQLFMEVEAMVSKDPALRPKPVDVLGRLKPFL